MADPAMAAARAVAQLTDAPIPGLPFPDDCAGCGEHDPIGECPKSRRTCGHHCNCIWVHDHCHWCDYEEQGE